MEDTAGADLVVAMKSRELAELDMLFSSRAALSSLGSLAPCFSNKRDPADTKVKGA